MNDTMAYGATLLVLGILLGSLIVFVWSSNEMARCYVTGEINAEKYVLTINVGQCQELCDLLNSPTLYHERGASCWQGKP